ncbi:HNH endonuclease [Pseudanabaena galeata UHCC 0370]|uniref:HNH endonuclease n=1 Tax=Pseudanabaena galeata UHCC 0370 TaxID=3110310 RepID=A0ABU5TIJ1_9CYAN|nr:HNH endonuclease [Pseudanabaena galeata]MEA5478132.1 HNH endonuclease [Pseudanabaena galeata UHCC 0370]
MKIIESPQKPFPNYKWRWSVLTPTESLNDPPIFLGVLRVFNRFNNYAPSSDEILEGLALVQKETNSSVDLVRNKERNLIRNSGQYWKSLGLLGDSHGKVSVSAFGKLLAEGKITHVEFATTVIKTLELPNRRIMNSSDISDWDNVGLKIKPLELILDILAEITDKINSEQAFITPSELIKIVIPLAGVKAPLEDYVQAIIQNRQGAIDISSWANCTTKSNDSRMAREFLLFLANYGFCKRENTEMGNENERYKLSSISREEVLDLHELEVNQIELDQAARRIRITQIPANIERKRVSREILERPFQSIFRKNILNIFNSTCLVTGVTLENVLEAAHIKPIQYSGSDSHSNGLCLRSDIHQLFDSNNLRISPTGALLLSESASSQNNYGNLPSIINIPDFVDKTYLDWRMKYY